MHEKDGFTQHIAGRLSRYMEMFGISQTELVKKMNVSNATVSDWVHAKKCPRMDKIDQMTILFGCDRSDLMGPDKPEQDPADEQLRFIVNVAKTNEASRDRLFMYARKLREQYNQTFDGIKILS